MKIIRVLWFYNGNKVIATFRTGKFIKLKDIVDGKGGK